MIVLYNDAGIYGFPNTTFKEEKHYGPNGKGLLQWLQR